MNKLMKAVLMALVIFGLAALTLTAQPVHEAPVATGPVELELWYGAAITEAGPPPEDWIGFSLIKEKLNIDLKISALPSNESDQDVKIRAAAAADQLPDLFMVRRDTWVSLVNDGLLAPVDDMYAKMPTRTAQQYDEASINFTSMNGVSYGLASPGAIYKNEGLLIRQDWLDNLGLSVPKTLDEFYDVLYAFTYNDPDKNGKNDTYGYGAFIEINNYEAYPGRRLEPIMGAFGVEGTWDLCAETFGLSIHDPAFYDYMVFMKKLIDNKVIDPNWMAYKKDDFRAAWKQGKFGVMREQNAAYAALANYKPFDVNFPNGSWTIIDPITGPTGASSIGPYTVNYRIYAISDKVDEVKKDAIARLLEWMSSDEGYYLLGWGVENVNYVFDADGIPVTTGTELGFDKPEGQTVTQLRNMVFYNGDVELYSRYPTYITETSKKEMSALKAMREMQTKKWTAAVGSDTMPVIPADLKTFYEQGLAEFFTGKRTLTEASWKAWVAEFDKLGGAEWEAAGKAYAEANNLLY